MSKESLLKEFCELVTIPVQSKDERAICDVLKAKLNEIGLSVYEDGTAEKVGGNTGNVLAMLKGTVDAPAVLFSSHMDRVKNPGKITPVIDEEAGIIRSDGPPFWLPTTFRGLLLFSTASVRSKQAEKTTVILKWRFPSARKSACKVQSIWTSAVSKPSRLVSLTALGVSAKSLPRHPRSARSLFMSKASRLMPAMNRKRGSTPSKWLQRHWLKCRKVASLLK